MGCLYWNVHYDLISGGNAIACFFRLEDELSSLLEDLELCRRRKECGEASRGERWGGATGGEWCREASVGGGTASVQDHRCTVALSAALEASASTASCATSLSNDEDDRVLNIEAAITANRLEQKRLMSGFMFEVFFACPSNEQQLAEGGSGSVEYGEEVVGLSKAYVAVYPGIPLPSSCWEAVQMSVVPQSQGTIGG